MASEPTRPTFPIEAIAAYPAPGMELPNAFAFSHDDQRLTYLVGAGTPPVQQLHALDVASGASAVLVDPASAPAQGPMSPAEELRRQRARMLARGLTEYRLAEHADTLVFPLGGDVYAQDSARTSQRLLVDVTGRSPALTPQLSPDGEWVAYAQDGEVFVISVAGDPLQQITSGARERGWTHGLAEYIAQEELGRSEGFWWSPDGRSIAFTEVDETHIPVYRIMHQGKDATGPSAQEDHRYPFAGAANASVRLAIVGRGGGAPVWMDLDYDEEVYLARVFWWRDGQLGAVVVNRPQTAIEVLRFEPATGRRATVLRETHDVWINLPRRPVTLLDDGSFLWASERTGYRHLYRYAGDGALMGQLTAGEWMVDEIEGVDEHRGLAYFTGNQGDPRETQLFAVALAGGAVRRITEEPGTHAVTLDHGGRYFVDVSSAIDRAARVTLRALATGDIVHVIPTPADPRVEQYALQPPQLVTLTNRQGTTLYGAIYRPPAHFGTGPYPTIVQVYGGPHTQTVVNAWAMTASMQAQYLSQLGFLVFKLDNRGSARRGIEFERAIHHRMGTVEVDDQVDGVRWLVSQGLADRERVGVTGWSYGGYMTLMCLAKAPEVFKVGVAGAPVTAWDGYDTAYTERYMATPQTNPEGYESGSALRHADQISGKLLLVHGLLDENVHFRHTARLINALIRARVPYDLLLFPDERHLPQRPADRTYLNEQIVQYFQRNL